MNISRVLDPDPYLDRNHAIVDQTIVLLACPKGRAEEQRSGTWSTVRHARQARRWIILVFPDGSWVDEGARPVWCNIRDERYIEADEDGHRWDGDHCIVCGFDSTDAMAHKGKLPSCLEWRS